MSLIPVAVSRNVARLGRYPSVLKGSVDALPYITETADNPTGNLAGMVVVLSNMAVYLKKKAGALIK